MSFCPRQTLLALQFDGMVNEKPIDAELRDITHIAEHFITRTWGSGSEGNFPLNAVGRRGVVFLVRCITGLAKPPPLIENLPPGSSQKIWTMVNSC